MERPVRQLGAAGGPAPEADHGLDHLRRLPSGAGWLVTNRLIWRGSASGHHKLPHAISEAVDEGVGLGFRGHPQDGAKFAGLCSDGKRPCRDRATKTSEERPPPHGITSLAGTQARHRAYTRCQITTRDWIYAPKAPPSFADALHGTVVGHRSLRCRTSVEGLKWQLRTRSRCLLPGIRA